MLLLFLLLHKLVALALLVEIEIDVFLALIGIVSTVPHAAVWVTLWTSVASEVFYRLVLDEHGLSGELLVDWHRTSKSLALLVIEDSIILCLCDLLMSPHR